jgi:hypothetical protein
MMPINRQKLNEDIMKCCEKRFVLHDIINNLFNLRDTLPYDDEKHAGVNFVQNWLINEYRDKYLPMPQESDEKYACPDPVQE